MTSGEADLQALVSASNRNRFDVKSVEPEFSLEKKNRCVFFADTQSEQGRARAPAFHALFSQRIPADDQPGLWKCSSRRDRTPDMEDADTLLLAGIWRSLFSFPIPSQWQTIDKKSSGTDGLVRKKVNRRFKERSRRRQRAASCSMQRSEDHNGEAVDEIVGGRSGLAGYENSTDLPDPSVGVKTPTPPLAMQGEERRATRKKVVLHGTCSNVPPSKNALSKARSSVPADAGRADRLGQHPAGGLPADRRLSGSGRLGGAAVAAVSLSFP